MFVYLTGIPHDRCLFDKVEDGKDATDNQEGPKEQENILKLRMFVQLTHEFREVQAFDIFT